MNESSQQQQAFELDRKRRIRRNTILLVLTSLAFYVGYIVMSIK
jgi:hypothetical protein